MSEQVGVLQRERDRQQFWANLGLPDPVRVEGEERITERITGEPFRSPDRDALDQHFTDNPADRPRWW